MQTRTTVTVVLMRGVVILVTLVILMVVVLSEVFFSLAQVPIVRPGAEIMSERKKEKKSGEKKMCYIGNNEWN